jgi:hypothetical protein
MNIRSKIFGGGNREDESPVVQSKKPRGAKSDGLRSISVLREVTRQADTRDEDRHRLPDEQVRVTYKARGYEVQLVNLSGGGAMVASDFQPKLWDRLQLHLGENGTIDCAVRWIKGDRIGLEFAHETRLDCSADKQAAVLREVIVRSFPDIEFEVPEDAVETPDYDEMRGDRRHPLIWSGLIHHDFDSTPIRLRNISSTGAMIECSAPLRVGAEPLLELGDHVQIATTVAWIFGDTAGLRFVKEFDLTNLARSRPDLASVKWDRPNYLESGAAAADSPWDEQWDRMSLGELRQSLEGFMKH